LLEFYQAEHGQAPGTEAARRAARRLARLVDRQLELINELEVIVGKDLTLSSSLAAWFAPSISDRLHRAALFTAAQLMDRVRSVPRRWWYFSEITSGGSKTLVEDQRVEFEVAQGRKGPQASNIRTQQKGRAGQPRPSDG
jgi:hypothetical protein